MTPQDFARYEREARSIWEVPQSEIDLLLSPPGEFRDWRDLALCAETDPEAFFPEKGHDGAEARRICARCDVRAECLEYALAHERSINDMWGIWGGLSATNRAKLHKQRASQADAAA